MAITTADKLVLLRGAYREAQASASKRLAVVLAEKSDALLASLSTGQVIQSTTGQGLQVNFSNPGLGSGNPQETARAYDELLTTHDEQRDLLIADGDPAPTDATIFAAMVRAFDTYAASFDHDHSLVAW